MKPQVWATEGNKGGSGEASTGNVYQRSPAHYMVSECGLCKKVEQQVAHVCRFINLNKTYPKDLYLLPNIDQLVNNAFEFKMWSFVMPLLGIFSRECI